MSDTHTQTKSSTTKVNDSQMHPLKAFIAHCGLNVEDFPVIHFLIETDEPDLRTGRIYVPIRLPHQPGWFYETFCRIVRMVELPIANGGGHRRYVEVEWYVFEEAVVDERGHEAASFLATQVICMSCRHQFAPDPVELDPRSLEVKCPHCLEVWRMSVHRHAPSRGDVELVLDAFQTDPVKTKEKLSQWEKSDEKGDEFRRYFAFDFEDWTQTKNVSPMFKNQTGWVAYSSGVAEGFESLCRSFFNHLFSKAIDPASFPQRNSTLEQTDIQRISTMEPREEISQEKAFGEFISETSVSGEIDTATFKKELVRHQEKKTVLWAVGLVLSFIAIGLGAFIFIGSSSKPVEKAEVSEMPVENKAPEEPLTPSEARKELEVQEQTKAIEQISKEQLALKSTPSAVEEVKPEEPTAAPIVEKQEATVEDSEAMTRRRQGMLHLNLRQTKEAVAEFERAMELEPDHIPTYRNLGVAYVHERRYEEAIAMLEKYLQLTGEKLGDKERIKVVNLLAALRDR